MKRSVCNSIKAKTHTHTHTHTHKKTVQRNLERSIFLGFIRIQKCPHKNFIHVGYKVEVGKEKYENKQDSLVNSENHITLLKFSL